MTVTRLKVGPALWRVIYGPLKKKRGLCHFDTSTITVHHEMTDSWTRDTLLHEALHAVFSTSGAFELLDDWTAEREEKVIRILAPWLLGLIRDNPELIAYLTE